MCDGPSIAVCCSESIECFPGIASKYILKLFLTIPMDSITTGMILRLWFRVVVIIISSISIIIIIIIIQCIKIYNSQSR
jgi:amino acid permease